MRYKYGGQVIGSGGFGCVFSPAIKCNDSTTRSSGISKLLFNKDANVEWKEISNVKKIIEKIPNSQNYFLLTDMTMCQPDILDQNDMEGISNCSSLNRNKINRDNINNNLNLFKIINMPDGGKDINYMFSESTVSFNVVNTSLINLLNNGVVPMNALKLMHNDLKGENILYKDELSKVIDWGLASKIRGNEIPSIIKSRVIQFNIPLSNILFTNQFNKMYPRILNRYNEYELKYDYSAAVWLNTWNRINGDGHSKYINRIIGDIIYSIYNKNINIDSLSSDMFEKHVGPILEKYTIFLDFDKPFFDSKKYFNEIYKHNCDIWGFIMSYSTLLHSNYFFNKNNDTNLTIIQKKRIAELILKYCYNPYYAVNQINVNFITQDLTLLNTTFNKELLTSDEINKIFTGIQVKPNNLENINPDNITPNKISSIKKNSIAIKKPKCSKGTRRNKKTGLCESTKKYNSYEVKKSIKIKKPRCPNGTRRNNKTGNCDKKI